MGGDGATASSEAFLLCGSAKRAGHRINVPLPSLNAAPQEPARSVEADRSVQPADTLVGTDATRWSWRPRQTLIFLGEGTKLLSYGLSPRDRARRALDS